MCVCLRVTNIFIFIDHNGGLQRVTSLSPQRVRKYLIMVSLVSTCTLNVALGGGGGLGGRLVEGKDGIEGERCLRGKV